ncbi:MAG: GIY-YIG nuclease family protein [Bacteroidia bacterium]
MIFYVYILFSEKLNRFYVGTTDDPDRRLFEHNSGTFDDAFTRKGIPWTLFLIIDGLESNQAYKIEQHIKKMKSRKYFQNLLHFPEIIDKLKLKYR